MNNGFIRFFSLEPALLLQALTPASFFHFPGYLNCDDENVAVGRFLSFGVAATYVAAGRDYAYLKCVEFLGGKLSELGKALHMSATSVWKEPRTVPWGELFRNVVGWLYQYHDVVWWSVHNLCHRCVVGVNTPTVYRDRYGAFRGVNDEKVIVSGKIPEVGRYTVTLRGDGDSVVVDVSFTAPEAEKFVRRLSEVLYKVSGILSATPTAMALLDIASR